MLCERLFRDFLKTKDYNKSLGSPRLEQIKSQFEKVRKLAFRVIRIHGARALHDGRQRVFKLY